jgi:hypothetical protein
MGGHFADTGVVAAGATRVLRPQRPGWRAAAGVPAEALEPKRLLSSNQTKEQQL